MGTRRAAWLLASVMACLTASGVSLRGVAGQSSVAEQGGTLPDGTPYLMRVPPNWNGTLIRDLGDHDWQQEYRRRLLETQSAEGSWPIGSYQTAVLATAWPVLILSEEVFAESRLTALRRWLRDAF